MSLAVEPVRTAPDDLALRGRVDGYPKVSGKARYTGDLKLPGMLFGAVVRSPHPHARIRAIHTERARALPGVHAVLTGDDIPYGLYGRSVRDIPALARGVVRYIGERVAAVAAETPELAEQAAALIEVEYDPLPAVLDPAEALKPDAPRVHEAPWQYDSSVVKPGDHPNVQSRCVWSHGGDVEAALARSYRVFERTFRTQAVHQGYLEPHLCLARVTDDGVEVWAPNKGPFRLRSEIARWMGIDVNKVHIRPILIGGDFGGKGDLMDIPLCIALAQRSGRPVRLRMRYADELLAASPRHPATVTVRLGVDENHRLTALDVRALLDGGAYGGYKPVPHVNLNGIREAGNCYRIPAVHIESVIAYTHTVPKGHMRSPGSLQAVFPVESLIDEAASQLGIDPLEFRRINMLRDGDVGTLGEHWVEFRSEPVLAAALNALEATPERHDGREGDWARGTGFAFYSRDTHGRETEVALEPRADGSVIIWVPFSDQGGGQLTVARRAVEEILGLPAERLHIRQAEPGTLGKDAGIGGSRTTIDAAEALSDAAERLRRRLETEFGLKADDGPEAVARAVAALAQADPQWIRSEVDHSQIPHVTSFCVQIARVRVDRRTGQLVVDDIITALDVANVMNPTSHLIQIEGGIVTAFGQAVLEDLLVEDGQPTALNLGDYKLPTVHDTPRLTVVQVEGSRGIGRYNLKAIGELTNVAVPAAIANAVFDAVGVRIDSLPITAEKIYFALRGKESGQ